MASALFRRVVHALIAMTLLLALGWALPAHGQPAPPAPGTVTHHDTNSDGSADLTVRHIDTDKNGVTDRIHIDSDRDGVIDADERVFDNVVGYMLIGGFGGPTITVVEDSGTERVKTRLQPFDTNGDGDCSDAGEMVQLNDMADSAAALLIRSPAGLLSAQLGGFTQLAADLNAIAPVGGNDSIPIEIVALSLTGGAQPITVQLRQPAFGLLTETVNTTAGRLEGRLFTATGTLDSFFDLFVELRLPGATLVNPLPLRLVRLAGVYPPAPGQTYALAGPVPLVDAATGQPAGVLEQFDWTPHVAPRFECDCEKLSVMPIITTHRDPKTKQEIVDSPAASGAVNAADPMVYDVEITLEWAMTIKCSGLGTSCQGRYGSLATSSDWKIDGKASKPVGMDKHQGTGPGGDTVCVGNCDGQEISVHPPPKTTYKVSVKKGAGGIITNKVSGVITLAMNPLDCEGNRWRMILVYEADLKKVEVRIDAKQSNWDGDKKPNVADKNPLDPAKD